MDRNKSDAIRLEKRFIMEVSLQVSSTSESTFQEPRKSCKFMDLLVTEDVGMRFQEELKFIYIKAFIEILPERVTSLPNS